MQGNILELGPNCTHYCTVTQSSVQAVRHHLRFRSEGRVVDAHLFAHVRVHDLWEDVG